MIIHVISIMKNEEQLLPYFLRHYSTFADKIFIIDDDSTDQTVKIAKANKKVQILHYKLNPAYIEEEHSRVFEKAYKKYSRGMADWVMAVDADEFIYHPDILRVLKTQQELGSKVIKSTGFTIFSPTFPTTKGQIYEECNRGARTRWYDKMIIFNPSVNLSFLRGRHKTSLPKGVNYTWARIKLLYFRYLSLNFSIRRLVNSSTSRFNDRKLIKHTLDAIDRHVWGMQAMRRGELVKVV